MDSRLVAAMARRVGLELVSLFIDYNPLNRDGAWPAACRTAEIYCQDHVVIPFPDFITDYPGRVSRWGSLSYLCLVSTALGASYASSRGIPFLYSGAKSDAVQEDFPELARQICASSKMSGLVSPQFPVFELAFEGVLVKGWDLGVDFSTTYSCSQSYPPCGECHKCEQRRAAGL